MECSGALSGVRVLDLADESGTLCSKLLADMGADVILIEPPGGSSMRQSAPFCGQTAPAVTDPNRSLFFWHYNTNKRSVTLDITGLSNAVTGEARDDRDRFLQLVAT